MTVHSVKCERQYFIPAKNGIKNFEVRYDDRNYQVGDRLCLFEIDLVGRLTGEKLEFEIIYILEDNRFLKNGYVVLGLKPCFDL